MAREIVYSESVPGVFEARPTRAQRLDLEKRRKQRSDTILAILLVSFLCLAMIVIVGGNIAADMRWL